MIHVCKNNKKNYHWRTINVSKKNGMRLKIGWSEMKIYFCPYCGKTAKQINKERK